MTCAGVFELDVRVREGRDGDVAVAVGNPAKAGHHEQNNQGEYEGVFMAIGRR